MEMLKVENVKQIVDKLYPELLRIRRHLHQFPELSFKEDTTSLFIQKILSEWNIEFTTGWVKTGIVGTIKSSKPGEKIVALRADMDALPIQEENDLSFCSSVKGVMHACGHDVHMACLLGALYVLNITKDKWEGTVKFVFQPGEEKLPGGASVLIKEGFLDEPKPDLIIGQHVQPNMNVGVVGLCPGTAMASCDELYFTIKGKGGHAALPALTNNPISIAAGLVIEINKIMDEVNPNKKPAVLSIGKFNTIGGATNVIPEIVKLEGTFRCMDEEFRIQIHEHLESLCQQLSIKHNCNIEIRIDKGYPCLLNNVHASQRFFNAAQMYLGKENVQELPPRMTSEDFAYYSQKIPAVFYRLGTGESEGVHSAQFIVNEESIKVGAGMMAWLALDFYKNT